VLSASARFLGSVLSTDWHRN